MVLTMTGSQLRDARFVLGALWGLDRPLTMTEMGRALRLQARDVGSAVRDYERGKTIISGPLSALVTLYLRGAGPVDGLPAVLGE